MMDKKQKLEMLRKLSEQELTKRFLIPLYESKGMGYKNVRYTHKKGLEYGRDMVCWKDDEYGNRIYTGVQVKKIRIMTYEVGRIAHNIREAFGEPFTDSDGKKQTLDRFVLLTSNEFLEEAKDSLWADLRDNKWDKLVTFVDGNQLVALLDKHLPSAFWDEYDYFNRYFNAMKSEFETIKDITAIGQKEPIPLEEIYVSLRLCEKTPEREIPFEKEGKIFAEESIEKGMEEVRAKKEKVLDAEAALRDFDKLVIVGVPGSGKTTLLKYLALKTCKENIERQERACVPIPIMLREFLESGRTLREYIDNVFEKFQFPKAKEFVEKDLEEGKCRLLLDGFDELATKENQDKIAEEIRRFAKKYPKSQTIVTSRVAGYHDELKGFTALELMEFDDRQIERFIENWFGKTDPERARSMFGAIMENEKIKAIARNPLMIAIIAIIYEEDKKLPQKRASLYQRCVEVLLSKWDVQKRLKNKYPSDRKGFILRKLAFYGHTNNKRILTEKEVMEEMLKYFSQIQLQKEDAKPLLDEIWQRSYLLKQISMDTYDFLHLSFQEYFTALELKEQPDGISIIIEHLSEPWWEEPMLLYAGIRKDATDLIREIKEEVPEDMFYSNLMLFGECVAHADFTEPSLREEIISSLWSLYQTAEFKPLRRKAIKVLFFIKPGNIIDSLIKDLESKEGNVRESAADALGLIRSENAIEPLIKAALTSAEEGDIRESVADALGRIGSEKAIEPLIKALTTDKGSDVRGSAADALGRIGNEKAIEPLIEILTRAEEWYVRGKAADALGRIGSEKAIEPLIEVLTSDEEEYVRGSAAYALGRIGSEKASEPLMKALTSDEVEYVRWSAAVALGRIGSEKAIEPLIQAFAIDKERDVRWRAANTLGRIGSEKAIEPLMKALTSAGESDVRWSAAVALGSIGSEKAIEPLIQALTSAGESDVRWRAAYALGSIGSEKAIEPLIKALTTDKGSDVRECAAYALGSIGSEKAIEPLKNALNDEGEWYVGKVKDTAFTSLEKISRRIKRELFRDAS